MTKQKKRTNRQTMINKTLYAKIEQY